MATVVFPLTDTDRKLVLIYNDFNVCSFIAGGEDNEGRWSMEILVRSYHSVGNNKREALFQHRKNKIGKL